MFSNAAICHEENHVVAIAGLDMIDRIEAWQCIGCGKIDAPQPCIGICQDRKVEFVLAQGYDRLRARTIELESLVRMFAATKPRDGEWERSYLAMQDRARRLLGNGNIPSVSEGHAGS